MFILCSKPYITSITYLFKRALTTTPDIAAMSNPDMDAFLPPSHPPPFLDVQQLHYLSEQGHLPIQLPTSLANSYKELATAASTFFDQQKDEKVSRYPPSQGTELGYYVIPSEKEYLTLRHTTSQKPSNLEELAQKTWQQTATLMHRIIGDISYGLDIEPTAWDPLVKGCLNMPTAEDPTSPTLLRMFRYYPKCGVADKHTDGGLLTLCVGAKKGLQVWRKNQSSGDEPVQGEWIDAEGPTLLIGSILRGLSSNRVTAGLHRVIANDEGRESLVFALRPITVSELDLTGFGGSGTVDMREFWKLLQKMRVNVNAVGKVREKQRAELAVRKRALMGHEIAENAEEMQRGLSDAQEGYVHGQG